MEKFSKKGRPYQHFLEPTAEMTITFSCRLRLSDSEPDELLIGIRRIVNADKNVSKTKRKEVTQWLADETIKIAFERRKARNHEGDEDEYRLTTALQKRVWGVENEQITQMPTNRRK